MTIKRPIGYKDKQALKFLERKITAAKKKEALRVASIRRRFKMPLSINDKYLLKAKDEKND